MSKEENVEIYAHHNIMSSNSKSWGFVIIGGDKKPVIEGGGSDSFASEKQASLYVATQALKSLAENKLNGKTILYFTDSDYLRRGITEWIPNWINPPKGRKPWTTTKGKPVKNMQQWQSLYKLSQIADIKWEWMTSKQNGSLNEKASTAIRDAKQRIDNIIGLIDTKGGAGKEQELRQPEGLTADDIVDILMGNKEGDFIFDENVSSAKREVQAVQVLKSDEMWDVVTKPHLEQLKDVIIKTLENANIKFVFKSFRVKRDHIEFEVTVWESEIVEIKEIAMTLRPVANDLWNSEWEIIPKEVSSHVEPNWLSMKFKIFPKH